MLAVALGRSRGTGRFGNMKLPSLIVWLVSKSPPLSLPGNGVRRERMLILVQRAGR
jgi:hypothetical protein